MLAQRLSLIAATLFCTTSLLATTPLTATAEERKVAVQSADLNLAKDAGRAALQQRIAHAIDMVCGPAHARTTADIQAYATCSKAARANAAAQYDVMVAKAQSETKMAGAPKTTTPVE